MAYLSGVQANFWNAVQNNTNPFNPAGWNWGSPWTYTGMAAGAFMGYAQSLQHCEYMVDIHSGSKTFLSNAGDGKFHIYRHGEWIDNHTAFRHERTMSNPLVRNIHAAQSRFWGMVGDFFDYLSNGTVPDVNSPYNLPQYHGGIVATPGGVKSAYKSTSIAVRSALSNRIGKGGYTKVGYSYQKHLGREESGKSWLHLLEPRARLNPATYNKAGYKAFQEIWKAPGSFQRKGGFIEKRLPDGRGIRLQENWKFKG